MKKKQFLIIFILTLTLIFTLAGCRVNSPEKSEAEDNKNEIIFCGLSAYEIYCKNYIYIESEKQWIDDLVAGKLECIDNSILEEKLLWQGTIKDEFVDNEIILTIDKYFYNKTFTIDDFHMIEVENVKLTANYSKEDLPGRQLYLITLKNKGKQNVINAIRKLEIFAFTQAAFPNLIDAPAN